MEILFVVDNYVRHKYFKELIFCLGNFGGMITSELLYSWEPDY